jgi:hypothetical protein
MPKNNRLIALSRLSGSNKSHIVTIDLNTGQTLSKVIAEGLGYFYGEEMDYDAQTNSYVLVSVDNEVLFFDVATGKIKEKRINKREHKSI